MDKDEQKIERRVDMAVAMSEMSIAIKTLTKVTDSCEKDRNALFTRIRQIDIQLGKIDTKQSGVIKGLYVLGIGTVGVLGKIIYKAFHP